MELIEMMEDGDKYCISKTDAIRTSASLTQMNSHENYPSLSILLTKLNIPMSCLDNHQIRQHYLEEYSAKYSKAKHLLSNARKKQRKIIVTYYQEKEKQDNIDELQTVKESLLEENERIKNFKEALKNKLILYQQRIQFLKDAEFWSALDVQQLQHNTTESIQTYTENSPDSPMTNDSLHLLHDDSKFNDLETDIPPLQSISQRQKQSYTELISDIETSEKRTKFYSQIFSGLTSNGQFDGFKAISMILMISLAIFIVIFVNDLLEYFLIYLTKPSVPITILSSKDPMSKSLFTHLLSNIYNWTTSWLLPFSRIFEFSF